MRSCPEGAQNRLKHRKNVVDLKLFLDTAPLESACIKSLGEPKSIARGERYLLVITECFKKLVWTVLLCRATAKEITKQLVNHCVFSYGPLIDIIADKGR